MVGGGGFVRSVQNGSPWYGPRQAGYATVITDTGHQDHLLDAGQAHNNLERRVIFFHQAVHRTAVTAKSLAIAYYGRDIRRSYCAGAA